MHESYHVKQVGYDIAWVTMHEGYQEKLAFGIGCCVVYILIIEAIMRN